MACQGFDEQLVRHDARVKDLMERFVRVRMVKANAIDLTQFQFDFDLTFAAFLMNADGTIYGRFGTRSDGKDAARDITIEGFRSALEGALELHQQYPANKAALAGKRGAAPTYKSPEDFPSLKGKYQPTLDYGGNPVKSCLHCHMIGEALRQVHRSQSTPMPDEVLYPWPMPDALGFSLDPKKRAQVTAVVPDSVAAKAGLRPGDAITTINGQPMLSIADVQWTMQSAAAPAQLNMNLLRGDTAMSVSLPLNPGWRRGSDISWRPTTWDLRRMTTGGLLLGELPGDERKKAGIAEDSLALLVKHVGQYGEHATAKKAGFLADDVIVSWDGQSKQMTESQVMAHMLRERMAGSTIAVAVLRNGRRIEMQLPMK